MMPGYLLTAASKVLCAHGGTATPVVTLSRVMVSGSPAVGQPAAYSIAGCPFTTPAGAPSPCTLAAGWQGAATRVTSTGIAVLLLSSTAQCGPNGVPAVVSQTQPRVFGT